MYAEPRYPAVISYPYGGIGCHKEIIRIYYHHNTKRMTKIKSMEMAPAISHEKDITISETYFGLCEKAVYTPTNSRIKAEIFEYSPNDGERLNSLLNSKSEELEKQINRGVNISPIHVGNIRAEVCLSDDHKFLAVNLLRFSNFHYVPMSGVMLFHGRDAETASRLFAGL